MHPTVAVDEAAGNVVVTVGERSALVDSQHADDRRDHVGRGVQSGAITVAERM
jgi:hypothetical protein